MAILSVKSSSTIFPKNSEPEKIDEEIGIAAISWKKAWQSLDFRRKFIIGLTMMLVILAFFPFFFRAIERRNGFALNDWLLRWLPAYDVSSLIFLCIWALGMWTAYRALSKPVISLYFLWSYVLLCLTRMLTISLIALEAPSRLIALVDPLSRIYYGSLVVTKDLFFSGHTATVFLMFLCLEKKADKIVALIVTIITAALLLIQHVHYTVDVLAAPVFTYFIFLTAKQLVHWDQRGGKGRKADIQV